MNITDRVIKRFWAKVLINRDGCWKWLASTDRCGYGKMSVDAKLIGAHVISYAIHFGSVSEGMEVAHSCDNPRCVNPKHLSLKTHRGNMQESFAKGRSVLRHGRGAEHPRSKLSSRQVAEIIELCKSGVLQKQIARDFGTTQQNVSKIFRGKSWRKGE